MPDTTNEDLIASLLDYLDGRLSTDHRWTDAIRGLVAERDGYLEGNKQTLRALEEANEIAKRYKRQRDEARIRVCELCVRLGGVYRRVNREVVECKTPEEIAEVCGWDCYKGGGA